MWESIHAREDHPLETERSADGIGHSQKQHVRWAGGHRRPYEFQVIRIGCGQALAGGAVADALAVVRQRHHFGMEHSGQGIVSVHQVIQMSNQKSGKLVQPQARGGWRHVRLSSRSPQFHYLRRQY